MWVSYEHATAVINLHFYVKMIEITARYLANLSLWHKVKYCDQRSQRYKRRWPHIFIFKYKTYLNEGVCGVRASQLSLRAISIIIPYIICGCWSHAMCECVGNCVRVCEWAAFRTVSDCRARINLCKEEGRYIL